MSPSATRSACPLTVNGARHDLDLDHRTTLLDALREHVGLTGTKKGCDHGQCGSCTVLLDGRRVNACLVLAVQVRGRPVTTVEGLGEPDALHPVQEQFLACDAYQCGYCTPGQVISAVAVLDEVRRGVPSAVTGDLAADLRVRTRYPVLARALLSAASGQLRNRASTGGNLLQRTRCVYFTDPSKPCNKREPGTGCPARTGLSRELAVLGTSEHCIATHPGDMAVALAALDAVVHAETADGPVAVPLGDLHRLPGDAPQHDTTLPRGAVITAVELPPPPALSRSTYRKARDRASYAFALVSVAGVLVVADGVVREVRLALGGVAHKPWRARLAEQALVGRPATAQEIGAAIDLDPAAATPTEDNAFKVPLARRLVVGTLLELAGSDR